MHEIIFGRLEPHVDMATSHAMRTLSLIFALLAAAVTSHAQIIDSVGVYSAGRIHEHDWSVGSDGARFGFDQYRQYQDASGRNLCSLEEVYAKGVASPRYTTVFLGPLHFTMRGPAWFAASLVAAVLASTIVLTSPTGLRTGEIQRNMRLDAGKVEVYAPKHES